MRYDVDRSDLASKRGMFSMNDEPLQSEWPTTFVYRYSPFRGRIRRVVDSTVAGVVLLIASPILVIAAAAVFLEDGTPIVFRQKRVGRFGKLFTIYKLRTMKRAELSDRLSPRNPGDSRITRVGRFLRKTSIDELPQLINVLRGDMALIGPRPEMPFVVRSYDKWQHLRHLILPGVTGIWQTRARKTIALERPEATLMDLEYIRTSSIQGDIILLARTAIAALSSKGAF
jgi:lipopolysaccharide/colanic/teichoic acid biosynthesis glycosyltransferase